MHGRYPAWLCMCTAYQVQRQGPPNWHLWCEWFADILYILTLPNLDIWSLLEKCLNALPADCIKNCLFFSLGKTGVFLCIDHLWAWSKAHCRQWKVSHWLQSVLDQVTDEKACFPLISLQAEGFIWRKWVSLRILPPLLTMPYTWKAMCWTLWKPVHIA